MNGAIKKEERRSDEDRLLKVGEVAAMLRLSRSAVYNLIWRGSIPYVNLASGNRLAPRVRLSDLREFLKDRMCKGISEPRGRSMPLQNQRGAR